MAIANHMYPAQPYSNIAYATLESYKLRYWGASLIACGLSNETSVPCSTGIAVSLSSTANSHLGDRSVTYPSRVTSKLGRLLSSRPFLFRFSPPTKVASAEPIRERVMCAAERHFRCSATLAVWVIKGIHSTRIPFTAVNGIGDFTVIAQSLSSLFWIGYFSRLKA
jgi:hypothetical protein